MKSKWLCATGTLALCRPDTWLSGTVIFRIIDGTGKKIILEDETGSILETEEPEQIHTYQGWKERGRQVRKGEKSITSIQIWKHTIRKAKNDTEEDQEKMFLTTAHFFKISQTEEIV